MWILATYIPIVNTRCKGAALPSEKTLNKREVSPQHGAKIIFANQLRAVAAWSVLISHVFGVYWLLRDVVGRYVGAPMLEGPSAKVVVFGQIPHLNFGPLGVAIFFLVSGFVIPFSLSKMSRPQFLIARLLRIYPTYIVCMALSLCIVYVSAQHWGRPFPWNFQIMLSNALLVNDLTGFPTVDLVNWTLAIEIKFYLFACVFATCFVRYQYKALCAAAWLIVVAIWMHEQLLPPAYHLLSAGLVKINLDVIARDVSFIPFMLIGTLFSFHLRNQLSSTRLLGFGGVLLVGFLWAWTHTIFRDQFPEVPLNYLYALAIFAGAYFLRSHFKPHRVLDWFASISYPFYALHSLIAYACVRLLTSFGLTYYLALLVALAVISACAYLIHVSIELPTMKWGKSFANWK